MRTLRDADFRPLGDQVLVEPLPDEEKTPGGIIIPSVRHDRDKKVYGRRVRVVAVGPGRYLKTAKRRGPMHLKRGDTVWIGPRVGTEVTVEGEKLRFVRELDVLAVEET